LKKIFSKNTEVHQEQCMRVFIPLSALQVYYKGIFNQEGRL